MPVARSVSASQLSREAPAGPVTTPAGEGAVPTLLQQKAHTLDRFSKPSLLNGHNEGRRKRNFMSFRLSKKSSKRKGEYVVTGPDSGGSGGDGLDGGGSDSSSAASVKPKRRHLTRVGSFVRRVASRVQAVGPVMPSVIPPPPTRPRAPDNVVANRTISTTTSITTNSTSSSTTNATDSTNNVTADVKELPAVVAPTPAQDYISFDDDKVPAVMGLRNHGNTCFINAIVQCLNHTDVLAEYFVLDAYKQDLRRCNRIGNRKTMNGARRGEMTEQVAGVLKALWSLRYVSDVSLALKACVDRHEASYRGGSQHDAAEFLMFLLGKVHDDLNTASKRKYKKIKNSYGRPDEVVASETLNNHLRCNSSFVQDMFQAQFRSSLRCPHCQKESNTFDPFMCVSLPIPHKEVMAVYVTVVYLNQQPKQVCLGLTVLCGSSCGELRATVAQDCGMELACLVITELDGSGFHRTFADDCSVNLLGAGGAVHAIELPGDSKPPSQDQGPFVIITWINVVVTEQVNIRFGGVYQSQVARDISYQDLQKLLLKEMTNMVTVQTLTTQQQCGLFGVWACDGSVGGASIEATLELPLYSQCVDQALALCCAGQPQHLKLVLRWQQHDKERYIIDSVDHVEQHSSVNELKSNPPQPPPTTLGDCLKLHSSAEQLSSGDAWHCPTCDRKQQGVKRLMLWSAPQILVLHLKRFRQGTVHGSSSSKLNTFVAFPLTNVDISDYVAQRSTYSTSTAAAAKHTGNINTANKISQENTKNVSSTPDSMGGGGGKGLSGVSGLPGVGSGVWSPWRKPKRLYLQQLEDRHVYDLYAVCNHHGKDLQGGHYTATCHNPSSGQWYQFDDSRVQPLPAEEVVTQDAYLLFYQRRTSDCCSVENKANKQHWSYRIPRGSLPASLNPPVAQAHAKLDNKLSDSATAAGDGTTIVSNSSSATTTAAPSSGGGHIAKVFERGRSYGTLPGHGRVLQSQDSMERENCSDTEAPLAMQEDSPIKKKRISDVQERRESEIEDEDEEILMDTSTSVRPSPAKPVPDVSVPEPATTCLTTADIPAITEETSCAAKHGGEHRDDIFEARCGDSAVGSSVNKRLNASKVEVNGHVLNGNSNVRSSNGTLNKIDTVLECSIDRRNSSTSSKTVLISKNQAVKHANIVDTCACGKTNNKQQCACTSDHKRDQATGRRDTATTDDTASLPSKTKNLSITKALGSSSSHHSGRGSHSTPDVLIQPASPAVLAAHRKSIITVTLRQRSPSSSSQTAVSRSPSTCSTASRSSLVSRASVTSKLSNASSVFSPETLASIITVNGVTVADNEELTAEFASSLAVVSAATEEARAAGCGCDEHDNRSCASRSTSLRNSHSNKTASYVQITTPAPVSPRPNARSRATAARSQNSSTISTRNKLPGKSKPSPNSYSSIGRAPSTPSGRIEPSSNGYTDCNPSIASRNSHNIARTSLEAVPCKNKSYESSTCPSSGSGTISYPCSTNGSVSRNSYSENLILRNSCGNFGNLDSSGGPNGTHNSCMNGSSSQVNSVKRISNRHSSSSLDDGSSFRTKSIVQPRVRYGSECLEYDEKDDSGHTEHRGYYVRNQRQGSRNSCCGGSGGDTRCCGVDRSDSCSKAAGHCCSGDGSSNNTAMSSVRRGDSNIATATVPAGSSV